MALQQALEELHYNDSLYGPPKATVTHQPGVFTRYDLFVLGISIWRETMYGESDYQSILNSGIQTVIPAVAAPTHQIVFLDFDGAETSYHNHDLGIIIDNIPVEDSGFDAPVISAIVANLNTLFDDVVFTSSVPADTTLYSTIFIGVTSAFNEYGDFLGLAETIDSGNLIPDDNAFVLLNSTATTELVTSVIAHETEHIVNGMVHGGKGLGKYAETSIVVSNDQSISNAVVLPENGIWLEGVADNVKVSSGGSFVIISGGTASNATVYDGGWMVALTKGFANSTTVSSGGLFAVRSGGTANFTVVNSSGRFYASSGGTGNSTTINAGGSFIVWSEGTGNLATVNSGGWMCVISGGYANSTTVSYGGQLAVRNLGSMDSTIVRAGGEFSVSSGGTANGAVVYSGGTLNVSSDGIISGMTLLSGGNINVSSGGTLYSTVINAGVRGTISAGATVIGITFNSGASWHFWASTGLSHFTVNSGAGLSAISDGVINGVEVNSGGSMIVSYGKAISAIINEGGIAEVSYGGVIDTATILSDGILSTRNGGLVNNGSVESGGSLIANYYGSANLATVNSDGYMYVGNYGCATSTTVDFGGSMAACLNGVADYTTVNSGGHLWVYNSGTALRGAVNEGGWIYVYSGGYTTLMTVNSGGLMGAHRNGTAYYTVVNSGGSFHVFSAGTAYQASVSNGGLMVAYDNGIALSTYVGSGGSMVVSNGGTANFADVYSSGDFVIYDGGVGNSTFISWDGTLTVSNGGIANETAVYDWGMLIVSEGGIANATTVEYAGSFTLLSDGTANSTTVSDGGYLRVSSGGTANSTTVSDGGYLRISNGGMANSTTVGVQGNIYVYPGGTATDILAQSGAYLNFAIAPSTYIKGSYDGSSFEVNDSVLHDMMEKIEYDIYSGGTAIATIVNQGCFLVVRSGGTASQIVENGGYVEVQEGANVTFASHVVSNIDITGDVYGVATVHSGTTMFSAKVEADGLLTIHSGGRALDIIENGGRVEVEDGAEVTFASNVISYLDSAYYGKITLHSGTTVLSVIVNAGETLEVFSGGKALHVIENGGYVDVKEGADVHFDENEIDEFYLWYDSATLHSGTTANGVSVGYGATLLVLSSGTAYIPKVYNGGELHVSSGGETEYGDVFSGGKLYVSKGGTVGGIDMASGAEIYVSQGKDVSIYAESGALVSVDLGSDTIFYGTYNRSDFYFYRNNYSSAVVWENWQLGNAIINANADFRVMSGGGMTDTIVRKNGYLNVESGGWVSGLTLQSGGYVELNDGAVVDNLVLAAGASVNGLVNAGASSVVLEAYRDGKISGLIQDAVFSGTLSIAPNTTLIGLSGNFTLEVSDLNGVYSITGNDFSQISLSVSGEGMLDLSGNYWGTTDIDTIYARLGVDSSNVSVENPLTSLPSKDQFFLESTSLAKNCLSLRQTSMSFVFNHAIDASTVSADAVSFTSSSGEQIAIKNATVKDNVLTIVFSELKNEGDYSIRLANTIKDIDGHALSSIRYENLPSGEGELLSVTARLGGISVSKVSPTGDVGGTVSAFRVYFTRAVDTMTLLDNVRLITPDGTDVIPTSYRMPSTSAVEFTVPAQTANGSYSVIVSSGIKDLAGNRLDQNGNGLGGEGGDDFEQSFSLTDIELKIKDVSVNDKITVGEEAAITWKVANESGAALVGSWTDGVYLSTDARWDIGDTLLATYTHENGLASGETLSADASLNLLGVTAGSYYLLVRSDIYHDEDSGVAASVAAQNLVATPVTVDVPLLSVGTAVNGTVSASGDFASYRIRQQAGESLQLTLDSKIDAANMEIYVGYGQAPSREQYDAKAQRVTDATMAIDAGIAARDVYVLVYAKSIPESFDYTLLAKKAPMSIEKIVQNGQAASEDITLTVTGRNFRSGMTARLVGADGKAIVLNNLKLTGSTKLMATVDAGKLAEGDYAFELTYASETISYDKPVSIGASLGEGKLDYSFYAPSIVGRTMNHTFYLTVSNTGTAAMDAPLVFFTPTQSHSYGPETMGAKLSLNFRQDALWVSTTPAGYSESLSFFVTGDVPGTLQPGESITVPIYYSGWRSSDWDFGDSHINWNVSVLDANDVTPLLWSNVFHDSGLSITAENDLAQAFSAEFGDTWGGYYAMVVGNLQYLYEIGFSANTVDTNSLLRFEAMQQSGLLQPFQTLATAEDLSFADGTITFERVYVMGKGTLPLNGSFGSSWAFNWDVRLSTTSNGDVQIVQGANIRLYQPTARFGYQAIEQDGSVLKNNSTGYRLTETDGSQWQFDANGQLVYVIMASGERISCSYDANGRLARLTNTATGGYVSFERTDTGLITALKDSAGKTISYGYSDEGDLISVTDSVEGRIASYEHYAAIEHALSKATDKNGFATTYAYDELGRIVSIANADGTLTHVYGTAGEVTMTSGDKQVTLYYDTNGNIAKITDDKTGKVFTYIYDSNGKFVSGEDSDGKPLTAIFMFEGHEIDVRYNGVDFSNLAFNAVYNPQVNSNHYTVDGITYYKTDGDGNILRQNDTADEYSVTGYDADGKLVYAENRKDGVTTTYSFNEDGSVSVSEDNQNEYFVIDGIKYFRKDMEGNVLGQYDTDVDSYTLGYDADGNNVFYSYTRNGETTSYQYDVAGNLISMTDSEGSTTYTYDTAGNKATETTPDGTVYRYDANGNLTSRTDANGKITSYAYDANGNIASITQDGLTVLYEYDADGNLIHYTDIHGNVYAYVYDTEGRQTSVTVNGKTTSYAYDANGNVASITDANGNMSLYSYNAAGALLKFTDANGNVTTYSYDDNYDLTRISYADGTFETYSYNADGDLTGWTGRAGQTAVYIVDANGDYTGVVYSDGKENTYTYNADGYMLSANDVSFAYDTDGNMTAQSFADGRTIQYTYNADGYMASYADELGHAVNMTYTVDGGYDVLTDENGGLIVDYDYDIDGYLVKAAYGNGTYTTYTYDDFGQVTAIDNYGADGSVASFVHYAYDSEGKRTSMTTADGTWVYTYDAKDQLIGAVFTDNRGTVTQELAYTYDAMGNHLTVTENGVATTYTFNELNQIVSANGFNYRYDANGNLLEDEKRLYTWTTDNRVASETLKATGQTWEYGYDALGNRVSSTTNGVTTSWTVDASGNVLAEYIDGVWNRTYYQGNLLTGFVDKNGNEYFYNADALGTTISVTGTDGSVVNFYAYDPWGNVLNSVEGVANDFTFVGGYGLMQNDSGTYFVRARNYDPQTGRWISPDPIGIEGGENLYVYCGNDGVNPIDISGEAVILYDCDHWYELCGHMMMAVNGLFLSQEPFGQGLSGEKLNNSAFRDIQIHIKRFDSDDIVFEIYSEDSDKYMAYYIQQLQIHSWSWHNTYLLNWCSKAISTALWVGNFSKYSIFPESLKDDLLSKKFKEEQAEQYFQVHHIEEKYYTNYDYRSRICDSYFNIQSEKTFNLKTFTVNKAPTAVISNTEAEQKVKSEADVTSENGKHYGTVILDAEGSKDNGGIQWDPGKIVSYEWYKYEKGKWIYLATTSDTKYSPKQEIGTKVKYGLRVKDNDKDYNQNGIEDVITSGIIFKTKEYRWYDAKDVTLTAIPPVANAGDDQSYVFETEGNGSHTFTVSAQKSEAFCGAKLTEYTWTLAGHKYTTSYSDINITVYRTEHKQWNGSGEEITTYTYDWKYRGVKIGSGSQVGVTLKVKDNYEQISENTASITLSVSSQISGSVDPNDKTVAEGVGEAGYVQTGSKLSYTVEFENDPEFATAPAQWVRVFDTLDGSKYDLDSFELQEFCIARNTFVVGDGRDSFNRTVELAILDYTITATVSINLVTDEDTGITQLVAEFMAVDPESGFLLQDLENGLLPVNDAFGSGTGHIRYSINALDDLPSGTEITNTAKIYFDFNDPIDTPTTLNTIDADAPNGIGLAVTANDDIITVAMSAADIGAGVDGYNLRWSNDGVRFSEYGYTTYSQLQVAGNIGMTYYFQAQAVDAVGLVSEWSDIQSVAIVNAPTRLHGTTTGLSWKAMEGIESYVVEYSTDAFEHFVRINVNGTSLDSFSLPTANYQWRVRAAELDEWKYGEEIVSPEQIATPQVVQSNEDGTLDLFFGIGNGRWDTNYQALHTELGMTAELNGRNCIEDIFAGSDDASILLLTDDTNGDALFIDDIYSAFPEGLDAQARIARIDEIRAGAGNDIVDLTSQRFEYVGGGMTVCGGLGDDVIWANSGKNTLFGDAGDDRIVGASGNDVIVGGIGNDTMHGGGGNDTFVFGDNWGKDTVEQLATGKVTLWFKKGDESKWDESTLTYTDGTNSVQVVGECTDIDLRFGSDDDAVRFAELDAMGAFDKFTSEKIFEDKNKGMLA